MMFKTALGFYEWVKDRYRITKDESLGACHLRLNPELVMIRCRRRRFIYFHGPGKLACDVPSSRTGRPTIAVTNLLWLGGRLHQDGHDGQTVVVSARELEGVLAVMGPLKRRRVSEDQRLAMKARGNALAKSRLDAIKG